MSLATLAKSEGSNGCVPKKDSIFGLDRSLIDLLPLPSGRLH